MAILDWRSGLLMAALWFFSLLGEEKRSTGTAERVSEPKTQTTLRGDLKLAWSNRQTRFFMVYLALSMIFAFASRYFFPSKAAGMSRRGG